MIDIYCNRHVEENEIIDQIKFLIDGCLKTIEVMGFFSNDDLNGADSAYASHIARANQLYMCYDFLIKNGILPDYQIAMLKDELIERSFADSLYHVSEGSVRKKYFMV